MWHHHVPIVPIDAEFGHYDVVLTRTGYVTWSAHAHGAEGLEPQPGIRFASPGIPWVISVNASSAAATGMA